MHSDAIGAGHPMTANWSTTQLDHVWGCQVSQQRQDTAQKILHIDLDLGPPLVLAGKLDTEGQGATRGSTPIQDPVRKAPLPTKFIQSETC